ncbi:MAG: helix-turn-helix transcriptional regulator, partial [Clostridia bacterium]|nr:helix-turn-helix transcriptional regulator [Clostridia bacterium]
MDTLKIGGYIQHLRKTAGLTQKELADRLGISFQAVSKWENGETLP